MFTVIVIYWNLNRNSSCKKINFCHYLLTLMPMGSRVKCF